MGRFCIRLYEPLWWVQLFKSELPGVCYIYYVLLMRTAFFQHVRRQKLSASSASLTTLLFTYAAIIFFFAHRLHSDRIWEFAKGLYGIGLLLSYIT